MGRRSIAVLLLCVLAGAALMSGTRLRGQHRVVWVMFRADAVRGHSQVTISDASRARRARMGIGTFDNDAPLPQSLVARIRATGANVREQSRWLRAVSVEADARALKRIRAMSEVASIRSVALLEPAGANALDPAAVIANAVLRSKVTAEDSAYYGRNWPGLRQLGIPPVHQLGYNGTGVRVAIFDTGFEPGHEALLGRLVFARRDFIDHDSIVADQPGDTTVDQERHGTQVWSVLGGFQPGVIVGPGFGAQFALAKIDHEPGDTRADEDRWVAALEWADSLGVQIVNSSVAFRHRFIDGTVIPYDSLNGDALAITRAADEGARRGMLIVQAMGDAPISDFGTVAAPADADSVVAVGAVDRFGNPAFFGPGFSARGPTVDGRTKPDVVALGTEVTAASSLTLINYDLGLNGTSYATAFVAGAAATFMQAWPNFTPMAVRRALQLAGTTATHPDNIVGWGVPDVGAAILFPEGISPGVIDPVDLTGAVTSIAPTFSWTTPLTNSRMHPIVYRVEVARDTGFTNIVFSDTVREAQSLTARAALPASPRLFWRVVANTPVGVTRASIREQIRVPDWVKLLTLAGDQPTFSETTQPELTWVALEPRAAGPFTYDVEILANGTGAVVQSIRNLNSSTVRVPSPLAANQSFRWRVIARARTGQVDTVQSLQPFVISTDDKPPATILYQNFPNPFGSNATGDVTRIWLDLATDSDVKLTVHDSRGRLVKQLIPARGCSAVTLTAGIYGRTGQVLADPTCEQLSWDGMDDTGSRVPNGIYILRLQAGGKSLTRTMVYTPGR